MSSDSENTLPMNPGIRLEVLFDEWRDARSRGAPVSAEQLCRSVPELLPELIRRIRAAGLEESAGSEICAEESSLSADETLRSVSEMTELHFHAKGGLGAVYRATDRELKRQVAVKFIHRSLIGSRESRERFLTEAEVTGRLEHPGIVPLYGLGETPDGRLFYAMRFIEGETMDQAIARLHERRVDFAESGEGSLEFRRLLSAFISVCKTIAYVHNRGIVHRDIKPANVMLGKFGESIVVDWGLAIPVSRDERFRSSGELTLMPLGGSQISSSSAGGAGTLAYMSPEQASNLAPTPASDIYSLGATLYKILCGEPAFVGDDGHEIRQKVIDGKFPKPSEKARHVPKELEAICLTAMQLQAKDRYPTALDIAADMENFLADEPVSVFQDSVAQRGLRWIRHHGAAARAISLATAAVLLISIVAAALLGALARSETAARRQADLSHLAAETARKENLRTSAKAMAQAIGYEIDLRWRLLEAEAQAVELRGLVEKANANPTDAEILQQIQAWLNERRLLKGMTIRNSNWSVFSVDGIQLARSPRARSIGQDFRHRDYFHGLGRDLDPMAPEVATLKPMEYLLPKVTEADVVHLSCVFQSVANDKLVVSSSAPIWEHGSRATPEILGLLSMTLEIDDFGIPENAVLFQLEESQITGQRGTLIAHPQLARRQKTQSLPSVDSVTLQRAERLMDRLASGENVELLDDFRDPLTGEVHLAAMAPIVVASRPKEVGAVGWMIVVEEASSEEP
jgi:tRNA A-37 threonylcarbamoyl transferase component Bud32